MTIRADIAELLNAGIPRIHIARRLHVDPATVRHTAEALGLPAPARGRATVHATVEDTFHAQTEPLDGGHLKWTGYTEGRLPMLFFRSQRIPAPRVAFRLHYGRAPEGQITRTCEVEGCVAGLCLADRLVREANARADRLLLRIFPEVAS